MYTPTIRLSNLQEQEEQEEKKKKSQTKKPHPSLLKYAIIHIRYIFKPRFYVRLSENPTELLTMTMRDTVDGEEGVKTMIIIAPPTAAGNSTYVC